MKPFLLVLFSVFSICASAQLHTWIEPGGGFDARMNYPYIKGLYCDISNNIYAGGGFVDANGYYYVAKWDGTSWTELGTGTHALKANDYIKTITGDAAGNIYAAGNFKDTTGYQYVAKWDGNNWSELGTGANAIRNPAIFEISQLLTDPSGNVYAAGALADDSFYVCVDKWNGTSWTPVGTGSHRLRVNSNIATICWGPTGDLYAAGAFTDSGSLVGHPYVAHWNGTDWSALGTGNNALLPNSYIVTICTDPAGNVYAAGSFTDIGTGVTTTQDGARYVAKWDGTHWSRLGGTTDTFICRPNSLDNITWVMSDASGNIYTTGEFQDTTDPNARNRSYIAMWDGTHWSEVGAASNHQLNHGVIFNMLFDHHGNLFAAGTYQDTNSNHIYVAEYIYHPTGIVRVDETSFDLYPNPNSGIVTLRFSDERDATVSLCDMSGKTLQTWQCNNELSKKLDISAYATGLYLLRVETINGESSVMKVVKH